jgi:hypothetical protein
MPRPLSPSVAAKTARRAAAIVVVAVLAKCIAIVEFAVVQGKVERVIIWDAALGLAPVRVLLIVVIARGLVVVYVERVVENGRCTGVGGGSTSRPACACACAC